MITTKIYPDIDCRFKKTDVKSDMLLETYVRFERKGQYWLLYVKEEYSLDFDYDAQDIAGMHRSFIDLVHRNKYLYMIDEETALHKRSIENKTLIKDANHLTEREQFLLNMRLV